MFESFSSASIGWGEPPFSRASILSVRRSTGRDVIFVVYGIRTGGKELLTGEGPTVRDQIRGLVRAFSLAFFYTLFEARCGTGDV